MCETLCFLVVSEPNFVSMDFVGESFDSEDGDDDKVYLFFSENAMEYDFYSKVVVSRVARVCKVRGETEWTPAAAQNIIKTSNLVILAILGNKAHNTPFKTQIHLHLLLL